MAVLAIGLAGAALGSSVGLGSVGFLVGSVIGNLLFPGPSQTIEGPRLGDLSVSASTYGTAIPLGYGTVRVGGNMIWSSGIREAEERRRVGGKGGLGGGRQTQVTYTYFVDMAIAFAGTEADDVVRMWADGKVIYDRTGNRIIRKTGLRFRFYSGSETQLPDSLIEADKGTGQVPGHRGLCYIVFDDLELTDFGNRIPNITAEIAFRATVAPQAQGSVVIPPEPSSYRGDSLNVDYVRRRMYVENSEFPNSVIHTYDYDTLRELRRSGELDIGILGSGRHAGRYTGNFYASTGSGNGRPIAKFDPNTFVILDSFGVNSIGTGNGPNGFGNSALLCEGQVFDPVVGNRHFLAQAAQLDDIGIIDADSMTYIWAATNSTGVVGINTPFRQQAGSTTFWFALHNGSNTDALLVKVVVSAQAQYDPIENVTEGVTFTIPVTFSSTLWGGLAGATDDLTGPAIDQSDDSLIFCIDLSPTDQCQVFKWLEGTGIVWNTRVVGASGPNSIFGWGTLSIVNDRQVGWIDVNERVVTVDTTDGTFTIQNVSGLGVGLAPSGSQFWDPESEAVVLRNTGPIGGPIARVFPERITGLGLQLSDIVSDLSTRAGLNPTTDIDVTELTDTVQGYILGRQITYRQAIEPLAQAFFFDAVESDDRVKFPKRGSASVLTLNQNDLIRLDDETGEIVSEQRAQEIELPERISVVFLDQAADYQQGTQSVRRIRQPVPTMRSREESSLELPIVLTATEAERIAERLLFSAWNERTSYRWRGPQSLLILDPTDVVTIALNSGARLETRLSRVAIGANLSAEFDGISENAATFVSLAVADGGLGVPQKLPPPPIATRLFMPNVPLLRDIDDANNTAHRVYFGMNGFADGWNGGRLLQSLDGGVSFDDIARAVTGLPWGSIVNRLPTTTLPFQTDETTVLEVFMQVGELNSVTQAQFLNDTQVAIIGRRTGTVWEVVAYRDAVATSDSVYNVSGFIRGKRGTDGFVNDHNNGELFLPVTEQTLAAFLLPLARRGNALPYKGVGFADLPENVSAESITILGYDLFPYSPVLLAAVLDGGNNIDFSWIRRTRLGGELMDGTGTVPLAEQSEIYEVDVKSGPSGSVVRTLGTGGTITSPAVQYNNADIITDFGSIPSAITFEVFQISAIVGRGFGREATITL